MAARHSANTSGNGEYHCAEELYVIPEGQKYLVYAPFEKALLLVNGAAVRFLQRVRAGKVAPGELEPEVVKDFESADILKCGTAAAEGGKRFEADSAFDPGGVTLITTNGCSMRCIYCYANGGDNARSLSWASARTAVDWMVGHARKTGKSGFYLQFHGGSQLHGQRGLMERCVAYARQRAKTYDLGVRIEAGLNGVMDAGMADWVTENLDGATLSLDGVARVQNAQRPLANGGDSFAVVSACLRRLDAKGFKYGIRSTVTRESLGMLAESIEYMCENFGARTIQVEPVFAAGRAQANNLGAIDPEYFVEQYRTARAIAGSYGKELKYSGARFGTLTNIFCNAAGKSFVVTAEGRLTSCYEVTDPEDPRSSLFHYGGLDQRSGRFVFNDDRIRRLRSLSVENKPYCEKCFCRWHCAGDCAAKLAMLGNAWDPSGSARCHINRELTKDQMKECLQGPDQNYRKGRDHEQRG